MKTKRPEGQRLFSFQRHRPKRPTPEPWPPKEFALPDTDEQIEAGRPATATTDRDQSRVALFARLMRGGGVKKTQGG